MGGGSLWRRPGNLFVLSKATFLSHHADLVTHLAAAGLMAHRPATSHLEKKENRPGAAHRGPVGAPGPSAPPLPRGAPAPPPDVAPRAAANQRARRPHLLPGSHLRLRAGPGRMRALFGPRLHSLRSLASLPEP